MPIQKQIAFYFIPIVIILYALPVWFGLFAGTHTIFTSTWAGRFFAETILAPTTNPYTTFLNVLLPITSAVTVATMWNGAQRYWTIGIIVLALLTIMGSIVLWHWFSGDADFSGNILQQLPNDELHGIKDVASLVALADSYLNNITTAMTTYLLMLLGIQLIPGHSP